MTAPDAAASGRAPAIDIHELTRRFGEFTAVDKASFSVAQGEVFGLIGPNGAGKTTLIKMLTTLLPPSGGRATIAGYDIERQPAMVRRHIGYVPQLLSADGSLTGRENLLLSARLYGIPRAERRPRIDRALATMGLVEAADHLVQRYSGGMIRRLEIAQSLMHQPSVLFLDEPTVGLDPVARETVWDHVREIEASSDTTVLLTTHYMEEADELCNRIALMAHGRVVAVDTPAALKARLGPGATLEDVFARLAGDSEIETEKSYAEVQRTRRAAREHG